MELHFLGTGSAFPSPKRCASCTALRHQGQIWIFDCGEGNQIQFHKCNLRPGRISKIFITHLHGDHLFGLPGLLCTIGMNAAIDHNIDVYGPKGIRNFLRNALGLSFSRLSYQFSVHEVLLPSILQDPHVPEENAPFLQFVENLASLSIPRHANEVQGTDIAPLSDGSYLICQSDGITVTAGLLEHTVPCIGYVLQEDDLPGKLDVSILEQKGVPKGPLYGKIKQGESVVLGNGVVVRPEDCVGPSRNGRKLVILGDTCNSDRIAELAKDCDLLVHECTNENADQEKAVEHGHSTPDMVGRFANLVGARKLILTHFSQRYRGSSEEEKEGTESVLKLVEEVKLVYEGGDVVPAEDFLTVDIPLPAM